MAKQDGVVKMEGTIGDLSFFKRKGEYHVRKKGGVSGDRIRTDPAFQRTRENQQEFARAMSGGKLVRTALKPLMGRNKFYRMNTRLTRLLVKVLHTDMVSDRGMRLVSNGDISLLNGFELNQQAVLENVFTPKCTVTVDRVAGTLGVSFPAFVPNKAVKQPEDATHLQLTLAGVEIDFDTEEYQTRLEQSANVPLTNDEMPALDLMVTLTENSDKPWLGIVAVEFYQEVNGKFYDLKSSEFNAMKVVVAGKV